MKAVMPTTETFNAKDCSYDKEQTEQFYVVVKCEEGNMFVLIDCRCWMGRSKSASIVYASIWVHGHCAGHGKAGGYGYHKMSAAVADAIKSAGIKLYGSPYSKEDDAKTPDKEVHFGGCGESAVHEALAAIAEALGYNECLILGV